MLKIKRTAALLLAAVLLLTLCCSCNAAKRQEQRVIGTCAGYDVLYEELRYITLTYKELFANTYGEEIWDTPESAEQYRAELEETVFRILLNNYTVLAACADYMPEDSLNSKTLDEAADEKIQEVIDSYTSKQDYAAAMQRMHMTEHLMRFTFRVALLENELFYVLTDDLGIIEDDLTAFSAWLAEDNVVYVQHIFVSNDAGDDPAENLAKIEDVRTQILNGDADIEDFVGKKINEDLENTAPYFIVRDVYTEEIEEAVFDMERDGAVSEVVQTDDGYYLFQRIEYGKSKLEAQLEDLLYSYQWAHVEQLVETYRADLSMEWNDYGKSLDILTIE